MKFSQKILRIGNFEKLSFFELAIFKFSFSKKQKICFIPIRISHKLCVRMDGTHYDSLQPKMSAGIINEHECISVNNNIDFIFKENASCAISI